MSIWAFEGIFSLDCGATSCIAYIAVYTSRYFRRSEACEEAEFSGVDGALVVCCHVDRGFSWLCDIVMGHRQTVRLGGDLNIPIDGLGCNHGCAETRIDSRGFAGALKLDAVVVETREVAIGSVRRSDGLSAERTGRCTC